MAATALCAEVPTGPRIEVLEGKGVVFLAGRASPRRVTARLVDSTGQPVAGAITFRLSAGRFASGMESEIVTAGPDGKATIAGMLWDDVPGPAVITATAVIENGHLTSEIPVTIAASGATTTAPAATSRKWMWISLAVAGAAGGGFAALRGKNPAAAAPPGSTTPAVTTPPIQIGQPTITIGRP